MLYDIYIIKILKDKWQTEKNIKTNIKAKKPIFFK